ncbi:MAG: hypothetical protein U5Q44_01660 [Dehalococcoidia bacterium]|nr:hypothetical protein [Dehalococcoidia bacterium]
MRASRPLRLTIMRVRSPGCRPMGASIRARSRGGGTLGDGDVGLEHFAVLKGCADGFLGLWSTGKDQDAAGVLVETVHNAGAVGVKSVELADVVGGEPVGDIGQSVIGELVWTRDTGRLVDDEDGVILVKHIESEPGSVGRAVNFGHVVAHEVAGFDARRLARRLTVDFDEAGIDEPLDTAT